MSDPVLELNQSQPGAIAAPQVSMEAFAEMFKSFKTELNSTIDSKLENMKVEIPEQRVLQHSAPNSRHEAVAKMDELAHDPQKMVEFLDKHVDYEKTRKDAFARSELEALFNEIKDIGEKSKVLDNIGRVENLLTSDGRLRQDLDHTVDISLISSDKAHSSKLAYEFLTKSAA